MMYFGDRLITLLQQRNKNRTEIAHEIGVSPQAVQQWTRKINPVVPKDKHLTALCRALKVPFDYFSESANVVSMDGMRSKFRCEMDIHTGMTRAQAKRGISFVHKPEAFGSMVTCDYINAQSAVKLLLLDTAYAFVNNIDEIKAALYDLTVIEKIDAKNVFTRNYCIVVVYYNDYPFDENAANDMLDEIASGTRFQIYVTHAPDAAVSFISQCLHQNNPLTACK